MKEKSYIDSKFFLRKWGKKKKLVKLMLYVGIKNSAEKEKNRVSLSLQNKKKRNMIYEAQCGNFTNSLSRIFGKNLVKTTFLLKKSLKR